MKARPFFSWLACLFINACVVGMFLIGITSLPGGALASGEQVHEPGHDARTPAKVVVIAGKTYYARPLDLTTEDDTLRLCRHIEDIYRRRKDYLYPRYGHFVQKNILHLMTLALHAHVVFEDHEEKNIAGWAEIYPLPNSSNKVELALAVDPNHTCRGIGTYLLTYFLKHAASLARLHGRPIEKCLCLIDRGNRIGMGMMQKALSRFSGSVSLQEGDGEFTFTCQP